MDCLERVENGTIADMKEAECLFLEQVRKIGKKGNIDKF